MLKMDGVPGMRAYGFKELKLKRLLKGKRKMQL